MNVWQSVRRSGGLQIVVTLVSGGLGIITSRIIITHFGLQVYGQYGLLASIPALLPFADLGVAAVIVNNIAASRNPRDDPVVRATLTSAFRILFASAGVLTALSLVLFATGAWPTLLGEGLLPGGSVVASVCLLLFALGLPLAVGQRLLVALGRNPVQVATQLVVAPFVLAGTAILAAAGTGYGRWTAVLPFVGLALALALGLTLAARMVRPQVGAAFRDAPRVRTSPGVPVVQLAWPMTVQMIALPIAMQTGRLVLSHEGSTTELAQYNLASQLFAIVMGAISMAGLALWPWFARGRSEDTRHPPWRASAAFAGVGLAGGLTVAALSPFLTQLASGGRVTLGPGLVGAFVVFLVLQAVKYPVGMYMTDRAGLRFQVLPIILMVPSNVLLAWFLVPVAGAAAPVIACAVGVLVFQVVPNAFWVRRDLARERAAPQLVLS